MKRLMTPVALFALVAAFFVGCGGDSTPRGTSDQSAEGAFNAVAEVKFVNASQRVDTYLELETTMGNILLLVTTTEVYLQTADHAGFDISSVAPSIRNGVIVQPGQIVKYYYAQSNVSYGPPDVEYIVSKIYVYRMDDPDLPAVSEE